jgi:predicted PhzF superfamily epimerase YddE/YHI9
MRTLAFHRVDVFSGGRPVTCGLNAGLAQWLTSVGLAPNSYTASQGTALGRASRLYVEREGENIWIGGKALTCIQGTLNINAGSGKT